MKLINMRYYKMFHSKFGNFVIYLYVFWDLEKRLLNSNIFYIKSYKNQQKKLAKLGKKRYNRDWEKL